MSKFLMAFMASMLFAVAALLSLLSRMSPLIPIGLAVVAIATGARALVLWKTNKPR